MAYNNGRTKWYKDVPFVEDYSKYNNRKTVVDGITFDSMKEANYYSELKLLQKGNVVKDIQRQVRFTLQPAFKQKGDSYKEIAYVADFVVEYTDGHIEVVDVKGYRTDVYKLKKKMLLYTHPGINFVEV